MSINKGINVKLNIQPVFGALIHEYVFEGPCRFGTGDQLTKPFDQMVSAESFKTFCTTVSEYFSNPCFNVLPPIYFERDESFVMRGETVNEMTKSASEADVYLIGSSGRIYDFVLALGETTKKPIVSVQFCCSNTMNIAMLRARGLEGYCFTTWEETVRHMRVERVRKVLKTTNVLLASRGNSTISMASSSDSFVNLDDVTKHIGPHFRYVDIHELIDQISIVDANSNHTLPSRVGVNVNEDDLKSIEAQAEELVSGCCDCAIDKSYVKNSLKAYTGVKKMLEFNECSAFSAPCPEACATTRLNKERFTFCFTHSLLNEEGIPSACEYDIPGLLSMLMLSNFSMSAPYLGNTVCVTLKEDNLTPLFNFIPANGIETKIPEIPEDDRKNLMITFHSVPNRKMHGFDDDTAPYGLRPFTGSLWGATMRYNFARDKGQKITVARFGPDAKTLFVARGTIVGSVGHDLNGCTQGVLYTVENRADFFSKQCSFGNHMPLVYGDWLDEVVELGEMLGLKVVTA